MDKNNEQPPQLMVPRPKDDSVFAMRPYLTHKDYYELLIHVALTEKVATFEEIKQWTRAWQKLKLKPGHSLTLFEKALKSRAINIEKKIYWDYVNKRSNEFTDHKLINDAINAKGKPR